MKRSPCFAYRSARIIGSILVVLLLSLPATAQEASDTPSTETISVDSTGSHVFTPVSDLISRPHTESYWVAGVTMGTPSAIQFIGGYFTEHFGIRLAAGYWGSAGGSQLDITYQFGRTSHLSHHLFACIGTSHLERETLKALGSAPATNTSTRNWRYAGIGYDINWHGAFLSAGINIGSGDYGNPQPLVQVGFVHELR